MEAKNTQDVNAPDPKDQALLERFEVHREFAKALLDAYVLVTPDLRILKYNQAFCTILGLKAVELRKTKSLEDLFSTQIPGSEEDLFSLMKISMTPTRVDEVITIRRHDNAILQTIIGSFPYLSESGELLGTCILMRDVTAENNLQGKYKAKSLESVTDVLSGLFTRRYFEEWIKKECERCHRNDILPVIGILMFDLDKFKNINDSFGHQAGDYVIATTAQIIRESARKSDIIGRYGGEEILALLVGANSRGSCVAAEKLRTAIESHEYIFEGKRIPVTTSVGISVFLNKTETPAEVIKRADDCLYQAKKNGRNITYCDFGDGPQKVSEFLQMRSTD
jgi:diguanylate cyclase (GGDEF)-like protein/PAS domain S-box-containing protein